LVFSSYPKRRNGVRGIFQNIKNNHTMANSKQVFSTSSPGFIYSITSAILTILAIIGVSFADPIHVLSGQVETSIQGGSFFALVTLVVGSVLFPVWNLIQKKQKINLKTIFGSTANIIALGQALLGIIALTGFVLPAGSLEQVVSAVKMKDWGALIGLLVTSIVPTIIRFIKSKKTPPVGA